MIEYGLAVVIPTLLALMLYSYVLFQDISLVILLLTLAAAGLMIIPARTALRMHYACWSPNLMPQRMITALVGMIYISVASIFAVSLISEYKGMDPQQPLTFATVGSLLLALIGVMAYSSKNKERFERMQVRYYRRSAEEVERAVRSALEAKAQVAERVTKGSAGAARSVVEVREMIRVNIASHADSAEVVIECTGKGSEGLCEAVKESLDELAEA